MYAAGSLSSRKVSTEWLPEFARNDQEIIDSTAWPSVDLLTTPTPKIKAEAPFQDYFETLAADDGTSTGPFTGPFSFDAAVPMRYSNSFSVLPPNDLLRTIPLSSEANVADNSDLMSDQAFASAFVSLSNVRGGIAGVAGVVPHSPFGSISPSPEPALSTASPSTASPSDAFSEEDMNGNPFDADHGSGDGDDDDDNDSGSERRPGSSFKERHNASERKRQATINDAISTLRSMLPIKMPTNKRVPKGAILQKVVEYMRFLIKSNTRLKAELEQQKQENALLKERLAKPAMPADRSSSYARGVSVMMGVMTFMIAVSVLDTVSSNAALRQAGGAQMDEEHPYGRALRALEGVSIPFSDMLVVTWMMWGCSQVVSTVQAVWFLVMHAMLLGSVAVVIKIAVDPMLPDKSDLVDRVAKLNKVCHAAFLAGNVNGTVAHSEEALELLGYSELHSSTNRLWFLFLVAINALEQVLLQVPVARVIMRYVVRIRRASKFNTQLAETLQFSYLIETLRDKPDFKRGRLLRHLATVLIAMNAAELGERGESIYSSLCVTLAKVMWQIRPPFGASLVQRLAEKFRRVGLWRGINDDHTENAMPLARYLTISGIKAWLDGKVRESVLLLSQASELHQSHRLYSLWRMNTVMIATVYIHTGELLGEAERLIKAADEFPFPKDTRARMAIAVMSQSLRYKAMPETAENMQALLDDVDAVDWSHGEQRNLYIVSRTLRAILLARLCRYDEAFKELMGLPIENDSMGFFELFEYAFISFATEAYLRLLQAKIRGDAGTENLTRAALDEKCAQWLQQAASFARLNKAARPLVLRLRGHYLTITGDAVNGHHVLVRALRAAEAFGWPTMAKKLRDEVQKAEEHCKSVGVFIGDEQNL